MSEIAMTDVETAAHLREWVKNPGGPWSWPTDGCSYDQHIRFVRHRNQNWHGGDFKQFVLDYADSLRRRTAMKIEWSKPDYLNIKWDNGPNQPASPLTEITRDEFLRAFFCYPWGLDGLNFGGSAPLPENPSDRQNWYRWQYFFFHRQALAIATKYGASELESKCFLPPASKWYHGYDVRFYRLGCLHPNMQRGGDNVRHESTEICPDCGFGATYDTSG